MVDTTIHKLVLVFGLNTERRVRAGAGSSERVALTLQPEYLCHQQLRVQQLRERLHSSVHQLSTEDGEQLLPHNVPLPLVWFRWRKTTLLPLTAGGDRVQPVGVLVRMDSLVLEVGWLTVCCPAELVHAAAGAVGSAVGGAVGGGVQGVAADAVRLERRTVNGRTV